MKKPVRLAAAGLAITLLTAGCAEMPRSSGALLTGSTAPVSRASTSPSDSRQETDVPAPAPDVTAQEAQATALHAVGGGWILETKIEERDGDNADSNDRENTGPGEGDGAFVAAVDVWEVTVVGPDGLRHKVSVAMTDGSVLDSRVDD